MSRLILLLAAVSALAFVLPRAADSAEPSEAVARLVVQLGSDDFTEREAAGRRLEALEGTALPMLLAAERYPDPEVRWRAAELVRVVRQRLDSRRLLEPRRIRLAVKDLPVPDAVAELARQMGADIQVRGNRERLRQRRISLDTGNTTFWDALARLCREAGLREVPTLPQQPSAFIEGRGEGYVMVDTSIFAQSPGSDGPFLLEEGVQPVLPSTRVGALSIRALPLAGSAPRFPATDGWLPVTLEVKPEPSIAWQSLVSLRIDRAVDEHGQVLRPSDPFFAGSSPAPKLFQRALLISEGELELPDNAGLRQVSLALRPARVPARRLRELHGVLAARIRPPVEPLVIAENVLKAKGRAFHGPDGTVLTISAVTDDGSGGYEMKVEVAEPPPVLDFDVPSVRVVNLNRAQATGPQLFTAAEKLSLFTLRDAEARPLALATGSRSRNKDGSIKLFNLSFQAASGLGPPVYLVYHQRRMALIEVPFVLKDVPLLADGR